MAENTEFEQAIAPFGYTSNCIAQITPQVFLSSKDPAQNFACLQGLKISHVLPCIEGLPRLPGLEYLPVPFADSNEEAVTSALILEIFPLAVANISSVVEGSPRNRILVHCEAGISRSSTLVIAWLMRTPPYCTLRAAYDLVKQRKKNIAPNDGFFQKLIELEQLLVQVSFQRFFFFLRLPSPYELHVTLRLLM